MTSPAPDTKVSITRHLDALLACAGDEKTVRVSALVEALTGRGVTLATLLLCLPFIQPVPVPGLSVVLGLIVTVLGASLALGRAEAVEKALRLPAFLGQREVDAALLRRAVERARGPLARLGRLFRCRLPALVAPPVGSSLVGASVALAGLALALPLPPVVLFSNGWPAWGAILLSLGYLEGDGLVVAVGHVVTVGCWIYFVVYAVCSWHLLFR